MSPRASRLFAPAARAPAAASRVLALLACLGAMPPVEAGPEDIEFVAGHLPEVAMDNLSDYGFRWPRRGIDTNGSVAISWRF